MGQIVAAMAMSHLPRMTGAPEAAEPEQLREAERAFRVLREELAEAEPHWMLLITNEHMTNAFYPYLPPFTVGVGSSIRSAREVPHRLEEQVVPSNEAIGWQLVESAWAAGFDLAISEDLRLDHGAMVPLRFLTPTLELPIIPLLQLTARAPRPPLRRCYELGRWLRQFIDDRPASERVAIVGAGGLSHWIGTPRMGDVNIDWNRRVLELVEQRRDEELISMTNDELEAGGNGAHEFRHWLTVLGAVPDTPGELVGYIEHIRAWVEGAAFMRFETQGRT